MVAEVVGRYKEIEKMTDTNVKKLHKNLTEEVAVKLVEGVYIFLSYLLKDPNLPHFLAVGNIDKAIKQEFYLEAIIRLEILINLNTQPKNNSNTS